MNMPKPVMLFIVLAILFVSIFVNSDFVTVDTMEVRNFVAAREMASGGSWLMPTMNGDVRIAKPPLPTWVTAVFMIWAATDTDLVINRIPAGIAALMLAVFAYLLVGRITLDRRLQVLSLLVLVTGYLFVVMARRNTWDIFSISFMTGAAWTMSEALTRRNRGRAVFLSLSAFFMACAFYSKGPVPFLVVLVPFLVSYALAFGLKDLRDAKWGLLWAFLLCALISAAWPLYVYIHIPHTAASVVVRESSSWFTRHTRDVLYYLKYVPAVVGIWIFFLLYGIAAPFIKRDWSPQEKFFVVWFIATIVVVSVFPEKKMRYLLPAAVPAAAVSSISIMHLRRQGGLAGRLVYSAFSIVACLVFAGAAGYLAYRSAGDLMAIAGVALMAVTALALIFLYAKGRKEWTPLAAAAGVCLCIVFLPPVVSGDHWRDEAAGFKHLRYDPGYAGREIYSLGEIPVWAAWASGKVIRPLDERRLAVWADEGRAFILVSGREVGLKSRRVRLIETIPMRKETYFVYGVNLGP
jgi:4-amino-4-deoxy-L-arabinose transferase-like glycosyltransferase